MLDLRRVVVCGLLTILACSGDDEGGGDSNASDTSTQGDSGSEDGSESDTGADQSVYGPCANAVECFENYEDPSCTAPTGDDLLGFCTDACETVGDCAETPGAPATIDCLDVYGSGPACVVLCGGNSCPAPMVCREVATNAGVLSMCFWPK